VGGVVFDYLHEADAGAIEFLVTVPESRRQGLGTHLLNTVEATLAEDARRAGAPPPRRLMAEMNDPFHPDLPPDSMDAFTRAAVWGRWGFRKVLFPYVQPPLAPDKQRVSHLMLTMKSLDDPGGGRVSAEAVRRFIHEYLRWAMRMKDPTASPEYREMVADLAARAEIATVPLGLYVGRDPARPVHVHEPQSADDPDLDAIIRVYRAAFPPGPTSVDPEGFRRSLAERWHEGRHYRYHLWAVRGRSEDPVEGMTTFFTFPCGGFGGYVALAGALRGTGRMRPLLARIEECMLRDRLGARGWYAECDIGSDQAARVARLGFREIAIEYRQPSLGGTGESAEPRLALLYKAFGDTGRPPRLGVKDLHDALVEIFRTVYGVPPHDARQRADEVLAPTAGWESVQWRVSDTPGTRPRH
jgi:GNAT superfamily N-acetyltransferase